MKHPNMKTKKLSFLILVFLVLHTYCQNYIGTIDTIKQKGLHKIMLSKEIRSAANENFNSLRIKDVKENEVPYTLIYNTNTVFSKFLPAKIISKKVLKDSITSLILANVSGKNQQRIVLKIANNNIIKYYTVSGSNDTENWFGLVSNKRLNYLNSKQKTFTEKVIEFPLNNYRFIRIDFDDKHSLPINILDAGVYRSKFFVQEPSIIDNFKQESITPENRKTTQLKFTANSSHKVNTIAFSITSDFFLRKAKIIVKEKRTIKKRIETYDKIIAIFQLNSKNNNTFDVRGLNTNEFYVEIENEDNPPLTIDKITFFQDPIYMVTNLNKDEKYNIIIDSTLLKPKYDIGNFISNTISSIEKTTVLNFHKVEQKSQELKKPAFWQTKTFMWVCLILGGIFVVFFALKLLKDINTES